MTANEIVSVYLNSVADVLYHVFCGTTFFVTHFFVTLIFQMLLIIFVTHYFSMLLIQCLVLVKYIGIP